jgi:hypothetical protein
MATKIKVCEKPCYSNFAPIQVGQPVSIIPVTEKNYDYFLSLDDMGLYVSKERENEFINGTLIKRVVISEKGYGGLVEYTIQIHDGTHIVFRDEPYTYLFRMM